MGKPEITKVVISGVIPTAQFTDIRPTFEVDVNGDPEGAKKLALEQIIDISSRFAVDGKEFTDRGATESKKVVLTRVETLSGAVVYRDSESHFYNEKGEKYLSASSFIKQYKEEFPADIILSKMVGVYGGTREDFLEMWTLQGEISNHLGKAVHAGVELYGKYSELGAKSGAKDKVNKALASQPYVKKVVEDYFNGKEKEDAKYEVVVADEKNNRIGIIDRLLFVNREKKIVRVQDLKTNADIHKEEKFKAPFNTLPKEVLTGYKIQLTWYAKILEGLGYTVEGLDIDHLTADGWVRLTVEQVDMKGTI